MGVQPSNPQPERTIMQTVALQAQEMENKHQKFLRLMQKRLGRVLEYIRLVSQLSSDNYENSKDEAYEVIAHLDAAVHKVADQFDVPYTSTVGETTQRPDRIGSIDEVDIARAIDLIRHGDNERAIALLRATIMGSRS